jgi:ribosome-binding factor A
VYYTSYGDAKARAATGAALRSANAHLRAAVGREVRLRYLPELLFEEDASIEEGERIDHLLASLHEPEDRG